MSYIKLWSKAVGDWSVRLVMGQLGQTVDKLLLGEDEI